MSGMGTPLIRRESYRTYLLSQTVTDAEAEAAEEKERELAMRARDARMLMRSGGRGAQLLSRTSTRPPTVPVARIEEEEELAAAEQRGAWRPRSLTPMDAYGGPIAARGAHIPSPSALHPLPGARVQSALHVAPPPAGSGLGGAEPAPRILEEGQRAAWDAAKPYRTVRHKFESSGPVAPRELRRARARDAEDAESSAASALDGRHGAPLVTRAGQPARVVASVNGIRSVVPAPGPVLGKDEDDEGEAGAGARDWEAYSRRGEGKAAPRASAGAAAAAGGGGAYSVGGRAGAEARAARLASPMPLARAAELAPVRASRPSRASGGAGGAGGVGGLAKTATKVLPRLMDDPQFGSVELDEARAKRWSVCRQLYDEIVRRDKRVHHLAERTAVEHGTLNRHMFVLNMISFLGVSGLEWEPFFHALFSAFDVSGADRVDPREIQCYLRVLDRPDDSPVAVLGWCFEKYAEKSDPRDAESVYVGALGADELAAGDAWIARKDLVLLLHLPAATRAEEQELRRALPPLTDALEKLCRDPFPLQIPRSKFRGALTSSPTFADAWRRVALRRLPDAVRARILAEAAARAGALVEEHERTLRAERGALFLRERILPKVLREHFAAWRAVASEAKQERALSQRAEAFWYRARTRKALRIWHRWMQAPLADHRARQLCGPRRARRMFRRWKARYLLARVVLRMEKAKQAAEERRREEVVMRWAAARARKKNLNLLALCFLAMWSEVEAARRAKFAAAWREEKLKRRAFAPWRMWADMHRKQRLLEEERAQRIARLAEERIREDIRRREEDEAAEVARVEAEAKARIDYERRMRQQREKAAILMAFDAAAHALVLRRAFQRRRIFQKLARFAALQWEYQRPRVVADAVRAYALFLDADPAGKALLRERVKFVENEVLGTAPPLGVAGDTLGVVDADFRDEIVGDGGSASKSSRAGTGAGAGSDSARSGAGGPLSSRRSDGGGGGGAAGKKKRVTLEDLVSADEAGLPETADDFGLHPVDVWKLQYRHLDLLRYWEEARHAPDYEQQAAAAEAAHHLDASAVVAGADDGLVADPAAAAGAAAPAADTLAAQSLRRASAAAAAHAPRDAPLAVIGPPRNTVGMVSMSSDWAVRIARENLLARVAARAERDAEKTRGASDVESVRHGYAVIIQEWFRAYRRIQRWRAVREGLHWEVHRSRLRGKALRNRSAAVCIQNAWRSRAARQRVRDGLLGAWFVAGDFSPAVLQIYWSNSYTNQAVWAPPPLLHDLLCFSWHRNRRRRLLLMSAAQRQAYFATNRGHPEDVFGEGSARTLRLHDQVAMYRNALARRMRRLHDALALLHPSAPGADAAAAAAADEEGERERPVTADGLRRMRRSSDAGARPASRPTTPLGLADDQGGDDQGGDAGDEERAPPSPASTASSAEGILALRRRTLSILEDDRRVKYDDDSDEQGDDDGKDAEQDDDGHEDEEEKERRRQERAKRALRKVAPDDVAPIPDEPLPGDEAAMLAELQFLQPELDSASASVDHLRMQLDQIVRTQRLPGLLDVWDTPKSVGAHYYTNSATGITRTEKPLGLIVCEVCNHKPARAYTTAEDGLEDCLWCDECFIRVNNKPSRVARVAYCVHPGPYANCFQAPTYLGHRTYRDLFTEPFYRAFEDRSAKAAYTEDTAQAYLIFNRPQ